LFAFFASGVFGSDVAVAFPFAEEDKQAALRGLAYIRDKIAFQMKRVRENAPKGLHDMDNLLPDFKEYVDTLNEEEIAKEAEVNLDCFARSLSSYDLIAAAVEDGTISYDEMGNLFCLERNRLFLKIASKKTLMKAAELFSMIYAMSGTDLDAAYLSCRSQGFMAFIKVLELAPIPEQTIDLLLVFDRASAENIFQLILSANLKELNRIADAVNDDMLPFERMQAIVALYEGELVDSTVKCAQSEMFFDADLKTGTFTADGRGLFVELIRRVLDRYEYIVSELISRSGEELIDFLQEIRFIDILLAQMPFSEVMRDPLTVQFSNLTIKKAQYVKGQLLQIKDSHVLICKLFLDSPADFSCNRFDVHLMINVAKGIHVDEGITVERIFIPATPKI
jgi:hypothetical protein